MQTRYHINIPLRTYSGGLYYSKDEQMVKGFKQIASLTMLSRILGMIRDICYSKYFGATALGDAWLIAFRIPNLSRRIFGEGAGSASFIPVYSEILEKDEKAAASLANTVATATFTLLAVMVLLGWLGMAVYCRTADINPETSLIMSLSSIMLPYAAIICTVAILAGILNVHNHFAMPAFAPVILNVFIIAAIVITGTLLRLSPITQVYATAVAVMTAVSVKMVTHLIALKRLGIKIRPQWQVHSPEFKKIMLLMGPMVLGATATQINTLADDMIAWSFSGSDAKGAQMIFFGRTVAYPLWRGCVMQLYIAQRLYQLPLGVLGIALATAIFPVLSRAAARKDHSELIDTVMRGLKCSFYLATPCAIGLCLIAIPFITVFFQGKDFTHDDTIKTSAIMCCYAFGLAGFFFQQIITKAFYAIQDSKMPAITAVISVITNVILNLTLIWFMGAAGLALATAICSYLQVAILLAVLRNRYKEHFSEGMTAAVLKVLAASLAMYAVGKIAMLSMNGLPWNYITNAARIVITMVVSCGTYYAMSKLLKIEMFDMIFARKKLQRAQN